VFFGDSPNTTARAALPVNARSEYTLAARRAETVRAEHGDGSSKVKPIAFARRLAGRDRNGPSGVWYVSETRNSVVGGAFRCSAD
jgi:hypothetical protein